MPRLVPIAWQRLRCVFEEEGFLVVRQEGDHLVMTKAGVRRPIVIPQYREGPEFIIKNNMRSANMTRDRYFELLALC